MLSKMFISGGNDAISCTMFAGTLDEVALKLFKGLSARSMTVFEDLARRFELQFSRNKKKEVGLGDLLMSAKDHPSRSRDISIGSRKLLS